MCTGSVLDFFGAFLVLFFGLGRCIVPIVASGGVGCVGVQMFLALTARNSRFMNEVSHCAMSFFAAVTASSV